MPMLWTLLVGLLLVVGCASSRAPEQTPQISGMPNPIIAVDSEEEATLALKFAFHQPDTARLPAPFTGVKPSLSIIRGLLSQAVYSHEGKELCLRKAVGALDPSGDYNSYPVNVTMGIPVYTQGSIKLTMRGYQTRICVATFTWDQYSYAINASPDGIEQRALFDFMHDFLESSVGIPGIFLN